MSDDLRIRLLIVDDEQSIRKLCMTVGEALGFACIEADSGESALALLEEQPAHIILTDMVMPNMSGLEFLERVKKLFPRTEVAVTPRLKSCACSCDAWPKRYAWWKKISFCANAWIQKPSCTELSAPRPRYRMCCA
ncbi:MAG: hypothetical protein DMG85_19605 [Acidobacteria bacterium]|nr:MAG: hypothetical protein DMG85_19605 [Acidobacteriota bacterium]